MIDEQQSKMGVQSSGERSSNSKVWYLLKFSVQRQGKRQHPRKNKQAGAPASEGPCTQTQRIAIPPPSDQAQQSPLLVPAPPKVTTHLSTDQQGHQQRAAGQETAHQPATAAQGDSQRPNMSVLLRARVSAFFAGLTVAGVFAVYQLRKDVTASHTQLLSQVRGGAAGALAGELAGELVGAGGQARIGRGKREAQQGCLGKSLGKRAGSAGLWQRPCALNCPFPVR